MKKAMYSARIEEDKVHCSLCPHNCIISPGKLGACRARKNIDGDLYSLNYGKVTSVSLDPIEKKPFKRFKPGSMILSAGTFGCNLKCSFCQNWSISQHEARTADVAPEELVDRAVDMKSYGNIGIAYTYNEPSIWYEFVLDTAGLAKRKGLDNVLVTNGYISREPLLNLLPWIDAMNIDVKAFTERFYHDICKAALENVRDTVEICANKCHVEVTTLVIPDLNDSVEEIGQLSKWLSSISEEIPLHLTRFFPNYKMDDKPPTPVSTLEAAKKEAERHLKFVYIGNI